jgi:hypothetical protein
MKNLFKIAGSALGVATLFTLAALNAHAQGNLLVDPSFSSPITITAPIGPGTIGAGWASLNGTGTGTSQGISTYAGNPAYLVTMGAGDALDSTGPYQAIGAGTNGVTISAGQTYKATVSFLTTTGFGAGEPNWSGNVAVGAYLQLEFNSDAAGLPQIGSTSSINNTGAGLLMGTWYSESVTAVAPAGATVAEVYLAFMEDGNQTSPEEVYFGNASLAAVPEPASLALLVLGFPFIFMGRRK